MALACLTIRRGHDCRPDEVVANPCAWALALGSAAAIVLGAWFDAALGGRLSSG